VVGRAPAVLSRTRAAALAGLLAALWAWDAFASELPAVDDAWDVGFVAVVLVPAIYAVVWLLLPLAGAHRLSLVALGTGLVALLLHLAGLEAVFNVAKLAAFALVGFWFLHLFEALSWVVLVAVVVPVVDIASVYRGPTRVVVEEEPGLFELIAVALALPGEDAAARLGPPDILFFALFLGTAARFGLRVGATWCGMTACLAATIAATYALDLDGLPGLPAIALGFLVPNADLLWRALRTRAAAETQGHG
jgi:hypothetical protein